MINCYLAIDIGASSGRHIAYYKENDTWCSKEIHRFKNEIRSIDNHLYWDMDNLKDNIVLGLKKAKEMGFAVLSLGIDTFGVDYALLDENDNLIRDIYCYQDRANIESKKEVIQDYSENRLFSITGTYPQYFNTIFQLRRDQKLGYLVKTKTILFFASYLYFYLTGKKYNELSFASTSGLLEKEKADYSNELLSYLGLRKEQFAPFLSVGNEVGKLKDEIVKEVGYQTKCVMTFTHDTAASCSGASIQKGELFLSSGTWSLLGVMDDCYHTDDVSFQNGFSNELNEEHQIRYLKNIVGMKLINQAKEEIDGNLDIVTVVKLAEEGKDYPYIFDASNSRYLSPKNMRNEIEEELSSKGYPLPKNSAELFFCIYHSLVVQYRKTIEDIEKQTGKRFDSICIFGGGNKNQLVNRMTEELTKKKVRLGPSEATSFGNVLGQIYRN